MLTAGNQIAERPEIRAVRQISDEPSKGAVSLISSGPMTETETITGMTTEMIIETTIGLIIEVEIVSITPPSEMTRDGLPKPTPLVQCYKMTMIKTR